MSNDCSVSLYCKADGLVEKLKGLSSWLNGSIGILGQHVDQQNVSWNQQSTSKDLTQAVEATLV